MSTTTTQVTRAQNPTTTTAIATGAGPSPAALGFHPVVRSGRLRARDLICWRARAR